MIHFHHQATFHILHSLMILTHSGTQDGPLQAQEEPFFAITVPRRTKSIIQCFAVSG